MKIYFVASIDQFIKPIINELQRLGHECVLDKKFNAGHCADAEIIWCEWADDNAILVQEHVTTAKKILRVHRYEVYTELIKSVMFGEYETVIFISDAMLSEAERLHGKIDNAVVISNLIPLYKIPTDKPKNNRIAYAGYIVRKKGIGELLMIAASLPEYEFHVAGFLQDPDLAKMLTDLKPENVHIHDWQDDMWDYFKGMHYVINTSLSEGFSIGTAEGIMCGCVPLVRRWYGADEIYPNQTWSSLNELKALLDKDYDPVAYRESFIKLHRLDKVMEEIEAVLTKPERLDMMESLTIGIVQTREKYLPNLIQSLRLQRYPFKVDILTNFDKDMTIGKAFNTLAERCKTEWILYVGDDDWLAEDYVTQTMEAYQKRMRQYPNIVGLLTGSCLTDGENLAPTTKFPTGFWRADFVRKARFNETLVRQVDTEFCSRVFSIKDITLIKFDWIVGYYYRQHDNNVSGNKFTEGAIRHQEKAK